MTDYIMPVVMCPLLRRKQSQALIWHRDQYRFQGTMTVPQPFGLVGLLLKTFMAA